MGGGTFQPLLLVAELQKKCDVTLVLNKNTNLAEVCRMSGVDVDASKVDVVALDSGKSFWERFPSILALLRARKLKRLARGFDICVSTANVQDFGKGGHHFIYLLSMFGGAAFYDYMMRTKSKTGVRRTLRRVGTWLFEYIVKPLFGLRPLKRILNNPSERIYPTSRYVWDTVEGFYGRFNGKVFYPPTIFEFAGEPQKRDPLKAIYVGRIFPPKRIVDIVETVEKARKTSGKNITLSVAGKLVDSPYVAMLRKMAETRPWLTFPGPVYGKDKEEFMTSASFALHAERDEAFGIAIAEYLKAGLVPVVPSCGGPKEIVDDPALEFGSVDEAAAILSRLATDPEFAAEKHEKCAARASQFSADAYFARQRAVVDEMTGQNGDGCK